MSPAEKPKPPPCKYCLQPWPHHTGQCPVVS